MRRTPRGTFKNGLPTPCLMCGVLMVRYDKRQVYCGSIATKTGCAWKRRQDYKRKEVIARYYRDKQSPEKYSRWLRNGRKRYHRFKEYYSEHNRKWRQTHPEQALAIWQRRYIRKLNAPGSHTIQDWRLVRSLYGNQCYGCGSHKYLQKDHIIPLSKCGTNNRDNIAPLCRSCNASKKDKLWLPVFDTLTHTPKFAKW